MSIVLPSVVDYSESFPSLPDGVRTTSVVANPVNLSTASPGSVIQFQLINNAFLIPDSIYIAYTYTLTSAASAVIKGTPVYMPFSRIDELIGSQSINTIQPFNLVANDIVNLNLSVSEKYGLQPCYGFLNETGVPTLETLDSRVCTLNETGSFSGPLVGSIFANCEKLIPLFAMNQCEIRITVDSIANIFTTAVVPTGFTLSNIELRYSVCDMGSSIEQIVKGMGSRIFIKTQSISASSQTIASGSSGSLSLVYNQKFNSIKALFLHLGGSTSVNTFIDAFCTNATSDYQFQIASMNYPQRVLSATTNRNGILMETKRAIGSIFDKSNGQSINSIEFAYNSNGTTTAAAPSKFIVGTSTRVLDSNFILTGVSSQNSPISVLINTTATSQALTAYLLVAYDAILEIDPVNRQASLKV